MEWWTTDHAVDLLFVTGIFYIYTSQTTNMTFVRSARTLLQQSLRGRGNCKHSQNSSRMLRRIHQLERTHRSLLIRSAAIHTLNTMQYVISSPIVPPLEIQAYPFNDDDGT